MRTKPRDGGFSASCAMWAVCGEGARCGAERAIACCFRFWSGRALEYSTRGRPIDSVRRALYAAGVRPSWVDAIASLERNEEDDDETP